MKYCQILMLNILVLCAKSMLTNVMLEQCISRRLQKDPKPYKIDNKNIQKIKQTFSDLGDFAYFYKQALYRSPIENGLYLKFTTQTKLMNSLHEFTHEACKYIDHENIEIVLANIAQLDKRIRIQIVTHAIGARASFTTPILPRLQVDRDCNLSGYFCTVNSTIVLQIIGKHRTESYLSTLENIWARVDQFITNDIHAEYEFLTAVVMRDVIENASHLPQGEKIFRLQQMQSDEHKDKMNQQLAKLAGEFKTRRPIGYFWNGLDYLNKFTKCCQGISWQSIGDNIFRDIENIFVIIQVPNFYTNQAFVATLKDGPKKVLEFIEQTSESILNDSKKYMVNSYQIYGKNIANHFKGKPQLNNLLRSLRKHFEKCHEWLMKLVTSQSRKARAGARALFHEAALNTNFNFFYPSIQHFGMIMWRDLYPIPRQVVRTFEQRSEILITVAQNYNIVNEEHIPFVFFPVIFPFLISRLIEIRDTRQSRDEISVNVREYILVRENMIMDGIRGQFDKIERDLWSWLQGTHLPKQAPEHMVVKIEKENSKKSAGFAAIDGKYEEDESDDFRDLFADDVGPPKSTSNRKSRIQTPDDKLSSHEDDEMNSTSHSNIKSRDPYNKLPISQQSQEPPKERKVAEIEKTKPKKSVVFAVEEEEKEEFSFLDGDDEGLRHNSLRDDDDGLPRKSISASDNRRSSGKRQHQPTKEHKSILKVKTVADSWKKNVHSTHVAGFQFSDIDNEIKEKRKIILKWYDSASSLHSGDLSFYTTFQQIFDDYAHAINDILFNWNRIIIKQLLLLPITNINTQSNTNIEIKQSNSSAAVKQSDIAIDAEQSISASDKKQSNTVTDVKL